MKPVWIIPAVLLLSGCIGQSERSRQQEAVEYQMEQHDSAKCADAGLLPGSDAFNACMTRLEGQVQPAATTP